MRPNRINLRELACGSWGEGCDALLLGRLGSELALIYHDTLQEPLPAGLQGLLSRLEHGGSKVAPRGADQEETVS